uniref:Uncharacterized protein n=1 Tax=uncultured marine virus TaxID=186617 RepID=A0A0F7L8D7_9VIRU|nr:hypothetical protein [uncultured marine virus]
MLKQKKFSLSQDVIEQIKIAAKADRRSESSLVDQILRRELRRALRDDDLARVQDAARKIT